MTTTPTPTAPAQERAGRLDHLYPAQAWELPVNPSLPAPRRAIPPAERRNLGTWRDYYHPNIAAELPVPGTPGTLAVIDKAFPHSLYDLMLLVADDDAPRSNVGDTPDRVLAALLRATAAFVRYLSDAAVLRGLGSDGRDGGQLGVGWNFDPTVDRDNGQWWDKRMHWHLNYWPASIRRAVRPVPLRSVTDTPPGGRWSTRSPTSPTTSSPTPSPTSRCPPGACR